MYIRLCLYILFFVFVVNAGVTMAAGKTGGYYIVDNSGRYVYYPPAPDNRVGSCQGSGGNYVYPMVYAKKPKQGRYIENRVYYPVGYENYYRQLQNRAANQGYAGLQVKREEKPEYYPIYFDN